MKKRIYLFIIFISFITNIIYYICFVLWKTDNSINTFFGGLIDNFPSSIYYLMPSLIPSLYFILFGSAIYIQKNIYFNLLLGIILIGLDIVFIRFFYGEINIDISLLFIRILFVLFYISICILCNRQNSRKDIKKTTQ